MLDSLEQIATQVMACTLCPLSRCRNKAVPGEGADDAEVVLVGEAPGYNEDIQGRPFVGPAGQLLNKLLGSVGLERGSIFITNVVKCRPPNNRPPRVTEKRACTPYLARQLAIIGPRIICPMGNSALETLVGGLSIGEVHGRTIDKEGVLYLPLYHPAAALYDDSLKDVLSEDLKSLKRILH